MAENHLTFLEQAGRGCISGNVSEWPQLKPACSWAHREISALKAERDEAREIIDDMADVLNDFDGVEWDENGPPCNYQEIKDRAEAFLERTANKGEKGE